LPGADPQLEPFGVIGGDGAADVAGLLRSALLLHGAAPADDPEERGILAEAAAITRLTPPQLEDLRRRGDRAPVFLFGSGPGGWNEAGAALAALGGPTIRCEAARVQTFEFADDPELWPFSGMRLDELSSRDSAIAADGGGGLRPLIVSERGPVFLRCDAGRRRIYLSLVPLPSAARLLKRDFCVERFMGLLPLMVFIRAALGAKGWQPGAEPLASLIVDDPNLRLARYGYLDLERFLRDPRISDVHISLAMIPLDYAKTRPRVAALVRANRERLSLVLHGVDHRRCEFASHVDLAAAETHLWRARARMDVHRSRTAIAHANAMTFPHGPCNETWLTAMRNVGLDAAISSRAFPFLTDDEIDDPLFELSPAQMTFLGFPVVNRFKAEEPKEQLLFEAWLRKPLIVYTHHDFFRDGHDRLIELASFLEGSVAPRWTDIGEILGSNFEIKRGDSGSAVRVFSNRVVVHSDDDVRLVVKPGTGFPADERALIDGRRVEIAHLDGTGLAAELDQPPQGDTVLEFRPSRTHGPISLRAPALSTARRIATELRDQTIGTLATARRRLAGARAS
jgi:hypothetical protein